MLLVVAAGCFAPLILYDNDPLLRYRVDYHLRAGMWLPGIIGLLRVQASDQPATLIALLAPLGALIYVIVARTLRGAVIGPAEPMKRRWIGGWLALFTLSVTLGALGNIRFLYDTRHAIAVDVTALPHLGLTRSPPLVLLFIVRYLLTTAVSLAALYGVSLIFRRRPSAPFYWTITCAVLAPLMVIDRAIAAWQVTFAARAQIEGYQPVALVPSATSSALSCLLWCAYWLCSRRVLETFGGRGLDLFKEHDDPHDSHAALDATAIAHSSEPIGDRGSRSPLPIE